MNILIISYEFPPLLGGAGIYARELSVGLSRLGHNIHIVTNYHGSVESCREVDNILNEQYGIEIKRNKQRNNLYFPSTNKRIVKTWGKRYENYFDLIFLVDARATRYSFIYMDDDKLSKAIHIFHGSEFEHFVKKANFFNKVFLYSGRTEKVLQKSNLIITVSRELKDKWQNKFSGLSKKIFQVSNGIDEYLFSPVSSKQKNETRQNYGYTDKDFIIISASRLIQEKGQDILLKSIPNLLKENRNIKVVIAGEGAYRRYLGNLSKTLGIDKNVRFLGLLDRENLAELYSASDLFVLPSRIPYEGFGFVYIEANACGLPVISGNTGGVIDAVENMQSGIIIDPTDQKQLENAIKKMFDDDFRLKIGKHGLNRVKNSFTNKNMAGNILEYVAKQ